MRTPEQRARIKALGSYCTCGHIGDKFNSEHQDTLAGGHGACKLCDCQRFTWAGFVADKQAHTKQAKSMGVRK